MARRAQIVVFISCALVTVTCQDVHPDASGDTDKGDPLRLLNVFSALHDPIVGQVRVFMEQHPMQRCLDISVCQYPETDVPDQPAVAISPIGKYRREDEVESLECFVTCPLPPGSETAELSTIILLEKEGEIGVTWPVERLETPARKKAWGICCAPVFSDVPQYSDWLSYHEALGAEGFHLYVARTDENQWEMFQRSRSGAFHVSLTFHHLVTYHEYHMTRSEVPHRYFSQILAINECVYRHRHLYKFLAVIDRDEFITVQSAAEPRQANLTAILHATLDGTNHAAATMFTGKYNVRCGPARRTTIGPPLAAVPAHMRSEAKEFQGYAGYDVFAADPRTPDFANCTTDEGLMHLHRFCHTKSILRPALVELSAAHVVFTAVQGYTATPIELQSAGVFLKHVRCMHTGGGGANEGSLCQRTGPVNYAENQPDGVEVCPKDGGGPSSALKPLLEGDR